MRDVASAVEYVLLFAENPRDAAVANAPHVISVAEVRKVKPSFDANNFLVQTGDQRWELELRLQAAVQAIDAWRKYLEDVVGAMAQQT